LPDLTTSEININPRRRSYFRFAFRQWAGLSTRAGGSRCSETSRSQRHR